MHNFFSEFLQIYCVVKTGKSIEIKVLKSILFFAFNIFLPIIANFSNKISVHFFNFFIQLILKTQPYPPDQEYDA